MTVRKLLVSNLVSVDGYLAAPGGDLSWFAVGPEFFTYANKLMQDVSAILFGRVTYEMMRDYWTDAEGTRDNDQVVVKQMNELPKYVFSHSLRHTPWGKWDNASVFADPAGSVAKLKAKSGKDMVIFGSGGLVSTLAEAGLIDEYRMVMNPVILGQGIPMFRGMQQRVPLKLVDSRVFDGNVVMLTYHPKANP